MQYTLLQINKNKRLLKNFNDTVGASAFFSAQETKSLIRYFIRTLTQIMIIVEFFSSKWTWPVGVALNFWFGAQKTDALTVPQQTEKSLLGSWPLSRVLEKGLRSSGHFPWECQSFSWIWVEHDTEHHVYGHFLANCLTLCLWIRFLRFRPIKSVFIYEFEYSCFFSLFKPFDFFFDFFRVKFNSCSSNKAVMLSSAIGLIDSISVELKSFMLVIPN